jgi:hypothetical protein
VNTRGNCCTARATGPTEVSPALGNVHHPVHVCEEKWLHMAVYITGRKSVLQWHERSVMITQPHVHCTCVYTWQATQQLPTSSSSISKHWYVAPMGAHIQAVTTPALCQVAIR